MMMSLTVLFFCTFSTRIVFASFLVTAEFFGECINVSEVKCSVSVIISIKIPLSSMRVGLKAEGLLKNRLQMLLSFLPHSGIIIEW